MRAEGMSVRRIAAELGVAKSSVSNWVRDIELPPRPLKVRTVGRPMGPLLEAVAEAGEGTRRCGRCGRTLPLEAFNRSGDGHQHWCRGCFKEYFRARGQRHRDQSREARERRREPVRRFVEEYLRARSCADCGEDELVVLEFDHVGPTKTASISAMIGHGRPVHEVRSEVERCEVVCVNCHRRRTATRGGWYRVTRIAPDWWSTAQRRNADHLIEILRLRGCVDCSDDDPVVLDFDHLRDKRASVVKMAPGCSLAALEEEIAKCDIRCGNCHRIRTLTSEPCWRVGDDHWAADLHT